MKTENNKYGFYKVFFDLITTGDDYNKHSILVTSWKVYNEDELQFSRIFYFKYKTEIIIDPLHYENVFRLLNLYKKLETSYYDTETKTHHHVYEEPGQYAEIVKHFNNDFFNKVYGNIDQRHPMFIGFNAGEKLKFLSKAVFANHYILKRVSYIDIESLVNLLNFELNPHVDNGSWNISKYKDLEKLCHCIYCDGIFSNEPPEFNPFSAFDVVNVYNLILKEIKNKKEN